MNLIFQDYICNITSQIRNLWLQVNVQHIVLIKKYFKLILLISIDIFTCQDSQLYDVTALAMQY